MVGRRRGRRKKLLNFETIKFTGSTPTIHSQANPNSTRFLLLFTFISSLGPFWSAGALSHQPTKGDISVLIVVYSSTSFWIYSFPGEGKKTLLSGWSRREFWNEPMICTATSFKTSVQMRQSKQPLISVSLQTSKSFQVCNFTAGRRRMFQSLSSLFHSDLLEGTDNMATGSNKQT